MSLKDTKIKQEKPVLKADPQHNSFVYADEKALEEQAEELKKEQATLLADQ